MKKRESLLLMAGASLMIGFASCQQEGTGNAASQATIDSIVNMKVDSIRTALQAQNDSLINVLAYEKADSIVAALKAANNGKAPASVPKPKPTTSSSNSNSNSSTTTTPTPSKNPKQDRFDGTKQTNTDAKKARFGDTDAQQKAKESSTQKKADRFHPQN